MPQSKDTKEKDKAKKEVSTSIPEKFMDLRLRDKLLGEGKITKAQVDHYLASLPDDSDNLETMELLGNQEMKGPKITGPQKS